MLQKSLAIAANTFAETIRQPIYNILIWVAAFWIAFVSPSLAAFSLEIGNDIKVMKDVGLATLLLYGLLAAVFSATSVITREIESQTVMTVISKPVARPLFILGKYLGVTSAICLGFYLVSLLFFMAVRHGTLETASDRFDQPVLLFGLGAICISLGVAIFTNYFYSWNFLPTLLGGLAPLLTLAMLLVLLVSPTWALQSPATDFGDLQLIYAVAMMFCAVLILTAFAIALSTRFSQVATLMLCVGVLLLGLMSDYFFGRNVDEGLLFAVIYGVVPNFQFFWVGDLLTQEQQIPAQLVGEVAAYAGIYTLAVLSLGVALFQTREVG